MIDYTKYQLSKQEYILATSMACIMLYLIGIVFFKPLIIAIAFSLLGLVYPKIKKKELQNKRWKELNMQFKQALFILSSALAAGRSIESAFQESLRDLRVIYPDDKTYIIREFIAIHRRLENGDSIENVLLDFSDRAGTEDIQSFTDVFIICKRSGGNLVEVMRSTANIIGEKLAIQQEIAVMISQKKFESKVLMFAPIIFVFVLKYSSPDYMAPLYQGKGVFIMILALILLIVCYMINKKIMDIKI